MFSNGFQKVAVSYSNLTPEDVSERVAEKYPYQSAVHGALAGAAIGAAKKRTAKGTLIGTAVGAAAGAGVGHGRKAWAKYKTRRLQREVQEYNLRATPRRYSTSEEE
jgi:uncharacterized membrane protein